MTSIRGKRKPNFIGNAHLEHSVLNLLSLREHSRNEIRNALSNVEGQSKHLIMDSNLIGSLNYILTMKMLNDVSINVKSSLDINATTVDSTCDSIIYLVYSSRINMKAISQQITNYSTGRKTHFYLLLMPGKTFLCDPIKSHNIFQLNIEWFPIDSDVISLEKRDCLKQLLNGNIISLNEIAQSLISLQAVFGPIDLIRAKGDFSCSILDIMKPLINENNDLFDANSEQLISECIIIDRTIDMITPCLTSQTYEGLLDDVFGIENSVIKVNSAILSTHVQTRQGLNNEMNIILNSSDVVYEQLRDSNFGNIGSVLANIAQYIQSGYNARYASMANFVGVPTVFKKLYTYHVLVEQHVHLAEYLAHKTVKSMKWKRKCQYEFALLCNEQVSNEISNEDYLEELIGKGESIENVLKFMILLSLTSGGIDAKKYDLIKRNIIQTYGIKYIFTLQLLERYALIFKRDTFGVFKQMYKSEKKQINCEWNQIRKSFKLIKSEQECKEENKESDIVSEEYDINEIGDGYCPLSVRLIEGATRRNGWKSMQKELNHLKGRCNQFDQQVKYKSTDKRDDNCRIHSKKIMLVFFVGGVTYAEISAIRMLGLRANTPWKFIVASTNVSNGNHTMNAFIDQQLK